MLTYSVCYKFGGQFVVGPIVSILLFVVVVVVVVIHLTIHHIQTSSEAPFLPTRRLSPFAEGERIQVSLTYVQYVHSGAYVHVCIRVLLSVH